MAVPALIGHAHKVVALVAKLGLVGVAIHARPVQAHEIRLLIRCPIAPRPVPHHSGLPVLQQRLVIDPDEGFRFHTLLFVFVDRKLELSEDLLSRTVEDIESIVKIIQMAPSAITIYTAPEWKRRVFVSVAAAENKGTVIKEIMKDEEMRKRGREVTDTVRQCTMLIHRLPPQVISQLILDIPDEQAIFRKAAGFLEKEFGVPVTVRYAGDGLHAKAALALPFKPALVIE